MKQRIPRGFTLIELLIVISIIAVVAAILFPVFAQSQEKARQTSCANNLRQIWQAVRMYSDDNDSCWPGNEEWIDRAWDSRWHGAHPLQISICPSVNIGEAQKLQVLRGAPGYAYSSGLSDVYTGGGDSRQTIPEARNRDGRVPYPATTIAFCEAPVSISFASSTENGFSFITPSGQVEILENAFKRHNGGSNFLFADGHLHWYRPEQIAPTTTPPGNTGQLPSFCLDERCGL